MYFGFRIIVCPDGTEIIDRRQKTSCDALTALQMVEYVEISEMLAAMELERKAREIMECRRKLARNPLYRIGCMCGLV